MTSSETPGLVPGTSGVPGTGSSVVPQAGSTPPSTGTDTGTGAGAGTAAARPSTARRRMRATGVGLFLALLVFVTVLLVLFVVFNTRNANVSLVFGNVDVPLVLALLVSAVLGGLIVGLAVLVRAARRRSSS